MSWFISIRCTPGHNIRSCPVVKGKHKKKFQDEQASQSVEDVNMIAPTESQDSESLFIPVPELNLPSTQLSSNRSSRPESDPTFLESDPYFHPEFDPSFHPEFDPAFQSDDEEIEHESDPTLMPKVISEANTRLKQRRLLQDPTGTRKISFITDESGVSLPTNLPYSSRKISWNGKAAMTSKQLLEEKEKRLGKMKARRGRL
ncbi:uncharacterized protein LOC132609557 [Lycium barbarum]|uniref:uncharacterized protein LOC132609557 n=1 Tax=Lycium barbarum TaxID=112863 RepID=UPI00293F3D33|nr:uncharacterized protein LOC132609557 [Lycium barbarum]